MTSPGSMSRDEVDRAIVGLGAAYDQISAAMYDLDARPGLTMLRGGGLGGRTREVAVRVLAGTEVLWSHFAALGAHLQQARSVRGERSRPGEAELRELTALLREPVVPIGADGLALDHPATSPVVERLTLPELARRLTAGTTEANQQLGAVEAACSRIAARWEPLSAALDRVRAGAGALGVDTLPAADVERVAAALARAHRDAMHDPLTAADPAESPEAGEALALEIAAGIDALAARLAELTALRDGYPRRAERLRATVAGVAAAEEQAGVACDRARIKIANSGLPTVPDSVGALRTHLAQLDHLHREGRWTSLAREMSAAERAATAALAEAERIRDAADGLLDRRAELRGRLDAFRARAARLGLAEDAELSDRHRVAKDLLYTSPCDLPAATRAVAAYQRHLNAVTERVVPGAAAGGELPT